MIKNWLDIQPAPLTGVSLYESLPFEMRAAEGLLWYRGNAAELNQFYMQTANDKTVRARFWATPTSGNVRKLHSGLPAILIDTLAGLIGTVAVPLMKNTKAMTQLYEQLKLLAYRIGEEEKDLEEFKKKASDRHEKIFTELDEHTERLGDHEHRIQNLENKK